MNGKNNVTSCTKRSLPESIVQILIQPLLFVFNHMVGMKTTGEQISILCHNGAIFDKPRDKNWTGHQKTRWSPRESKIDLRLS